MLVKCQDTGEKIDRDVAYKVVTKSGNKYYTSKEAYERIQKDKEYRVKVIETIRDYLGYYKPQMLLPTLTYKKIAEYQEPIGYDVLYDTLVNNKKNIIWAFNNKDFKSETAKIMYLFAIIQNNYMNEYRKKVERNRLKNTYSESDPNEMITDDKNRKQSIKNIRKWLDED